MKLYRFSDIDSDEGFIQAAYNYDDSEDYVFDKLTDDIFNLTAIFEDELPAPNVRIPDGSKFYFTEKGNRKFHKAIMKLNKFLNEHDIATIHTTIIEYDDVKDQIVYEDTYQVAIHL